MHRQTLENYGSGGDGFPPKTPNRISANLFKKAFSLEPAMALA